MTTARNSKNCENQRTLTKSGASKQKVTPYKYEDAMKFMNDIDLDKRRYMFSAHFQFS